MTGRELKNLRYKKEWKATWLAQQLGCCRQTIANWEKEEHKPIPKAMALAIKALLSDL